MGENIVANVINSYNVLLRFDKSCVASSKHGFKLFTQLRDDYFVSVKVFAFDYEGNI